MLIQFGHQHHFYKNYLLVMEMVNNGMEKQLQEDLVTQEPQILVNFYI
jgi:hypothetical protein